MSPLERAQPDASCPSETTETRGEILHSLTPAALAVIVLGVLGLGGSLLIATVSSDSSASTAHVRGPAPEILYQPPGATMPATDEMERNTEAPLAGLILARPGDNPQTASVESEAPTLAPSPLRLAIAPPHEALAWTNAPTSSYVDRFPGLGGTMTGPNETGFDAISNAAVPEPSTVALLTGALVALACLSRLRRRRRAGRA